VYVVGDRILHRKLLEDPTHILLTMAGSILVSLLTFRAIEVPARRRLRSLLVGQGAPASWNRR
jgi:peptidoglycan/LPS O-acetylase OafA/YrhL